MNNDLITYTEAAGRYNVSYLSICRLVQQGLIKPVKIRKTAYLDTDILEELHRTREIKSLKNLIQEAENSRGEE